VDDGADATVASPDPLVLVGLTGTVVVSADNGEDAELAALDVAYWTGTPLTVTGSGALAVVRIRSTSISGG